MLAGKAADPTGGVLGSAVGVAGACDADEPAGPGRDAGPATVGWPVGTLSGELAITADRVKAAAAAITTATVPAVYAAARRCRLAARSTRDCASGRGASDHRGSRSNSRSRSSSFTGSSLVDAFWLQ